MSFLGVVLRFIYFYTAMTARKLQNIFFLQTVLQIVSHCNR